MSKQKQLEMSLETALVANQGLAERNEHLCDLLERGLELIEEARRVIEYDSVGSSLNEDWLDRSSQWIEEVLK